MRPARSDIATIASVAQLLAAILLVAMLFFARDVFIPISLGVLLSFLLSPLVNHLQRIGVPNVVAVIVAAVLSFMLLASGLTLLGSQLTTLVNDLPEHKDELVLKARGLAGLTNGMGGSFDKLTEEITGALEGGENPGTATKTDTASDSPGDVAKTSDDRTRFERWAAEVFSSTVQTQNKTINDGKSLQAPLYVQQVERSLPLENWASTAGTVLGPLGTAGLVAVFTLFMLIYREDLRDRMISVISNGDYITTTEALDEAAHRISRYLIAQSMINASYGFILAVGLFTIGVTMSSDGTFPNVMLWGVLATCLRFVPYIGPTAAAVFPLALSAAVFPGYSVFLATLAFIVTLELISNNVLEPWLYGSSTGISAVAVIFAAVFWGWLWGPVGLLLSTPLTVCLVVIGRYVPRFRFLSTLLSDDVQIKPSVRFYQRLLATDLSRAEEMLREYHSEHGYNRTCDNVLLPTIKRLRNDRIADQLTDEEANTLVMKFESIISSKKWHDGTEKKADESAGDQESSSASVFGCISHDAVERLLLKMLDVSPSPSWNLRIIDDEQLPTEIAKEIFEAKPCAVVIVVIPKGGIEQARFQSRAIRHEGYRGTIIIACLGKFKNFDKLFVKFRQAGASSVTTTFTQTRSKIERSARQYIKSNDSKTSVAPTQATLPAF